MFRNRVSIKPWATQHGHFKVTHLYMSNVKYLCYHASVLLMDIMALIFLIDIWWNK